jgi:hypothetical protein
MPLSVATSPGETVMFLSVATPGEAVMFLSVAVFNKKAMLLSIVVVRIAATAAVRNNF